MKKFLISMLVVLMALPCTAFAEEAYQTSVALCCDGDAYSVDYVFEVPEGANILSVSLMASGCFYDWNFVEDENKLYVSIASANPIKKAKAIARIVCDRQDLISVPYSMIVNGKLQHNASAYHYATNMEWVSPGYDTPGSFGGEVCERCGITLSEPSPVSPTGPKVNAVLAASGALTVSGGLSDTPTAEGTTLLAVYNKDNRLLALSNITAQDQSDFGISVENMKDAYRVKVLRWDMADLKPLYGAAEGMVQ